LAFTLALLDLAGTRDDRAPLTCAETSTLRVLQELEKSIAQRPTGAELCSLVSGEARTDKQGSFTAKSLKRCTVLQHLSIPAIHWRLSKLENEDFIERTGKTSREVMWMLTERGHAYGGVPLADRIRKWLRVPELVATSEETTLHSLIRRFESPKAPELQASFGEGPGGSNGGEPGREHRVCSFRGIEASVP
jgi:hypothetical protein